MQVIHALSSGSIQPPAVRLSDSDVPFCILPVNQPPPARLTSESLARLCQHQDFTPARCDVRAGPLRRAFSPARPGPLAASAIRSALRLPRRPCPQAEQIWPAARKPVAPRPAARLPQVTVRRLPVPLLLVGPSQSLSTI
jgi:hypothetical protein